MCFCPLVSRAHQQKILDHANIVLEAAERQLANAEDERHAGSVLGRVDVADVLHVVAVDAFPALEAPVLHLARPHVAAVCRRDLTAALASP